MPRPKQLSDEALLEAAMPAIFGKVPGEMTLAEVARAVGLSPATLLQRFGSKQELVVAALAHANEKNFAALDRLAPDRGAEAVIRIFLDRTPGPEHEGLLGDQLLWLRAGMADPHINKLSRDYFVRFRQALVERLPSLSIAAEDAVLLVEAQWHGALTQWGIDRKGHLRDYVEARLRALFEALGA